MSDIPKGYCRCGCGQKTNIIKRNNHILGHIKGEPFRFISQHHKRGVNNHNWNGGKTLHDRGYIMVSCPDHPKANKHTGYIYEHILVAEKVFGKYLPDGAIVHHIDGDVSNNNPHNLVICQDVAYHLLLHQRERALNDCGHASWRRCMFCRNYDDPEKMYSPRRSGAYHRECRNADIREKRKKWTY